ncbi:MAG TPA: M1 family aminopeptidase, partial [Myxococcota bacterium]|nr:M1 family aminopeptidase [Myxococcota bacterium]
LQRSRRGGVPLALAAYERVEAACGPVSLELYAIPGTSIDGYPIAPASYGPVVAALCQSLTAMFAEPFVSTIRLVGVDERFSSGLSAAGMILVPNYTWDDDGSGSFPRRDFYLAHELCHQWWSGSMAAQARDLWLVEGTADFAALAAAGERHGAEVADWLWLWEAEPLLGLYRLGQPEQPLVPAPGVAVDPRITYVKGAWVLRMLEDVAGPQAVAGGLRTLRELHRDTPFASEDFTALVDGLAGSDLGWFHSQWLQGLGLLELAEQHQALGAELQIQLEQRRGWAAAPVQYFRAPLVLRAEQAGRSSQDTFQLVSATHSFSLPLP